MPLDDSPTLSAPVRAQLRLRLRRWLGLLAPDAPRRSPLRSEVLARAAGHLPAGDGDRALRRRITGALFTELHRAAEAASDDPFVAAARTWALGAPQPATAESLSAWDALLTAVELRPSTIAAADVPRLLDRARAAQSDAFALTRWSQAARHVVETEGIGRWLGRQGVRTVDAAVATLWATVERALIEVAPPAERPARVRQAMLNLIAWDRRVEHITAEVSRIRGADAGQATAARLLEPRIMSAWLTLPPDDLLRLGLTCGRNIALATLTGPEVPTSPAIDAVVSPTPDPERALGHQQRWRAFFGGLTRAIESGRLDARGAVFLWLSAGVGAGEAWRATGGDPARIGSANYARNKALETLRDAVGGLPRRLANPGAPDPRTRSVLGQLAMRDAPDPSVETDAAVPADARIVAPPLSDRGLLALMYLLNLGPEGLTLLPTDWPRPDPAALLTRALRNGRWATERRAVVCDRLRRAGAVPGWPTTADLLLMLGSATAGSSADAAVWANARLDGGDPHVVERWLAAEGPAHEALARLRGLDRTSLTPPDEVLPKRPVEREAKLRLHLRRLTEDAP